MKGNSGLLEKGVANVANVAKGNGNVGRYCINFSLNNCSSRESFVNWISNKKTETYHWLSKRVCIHYLQ